MHATALNHYLVSEDAFAVPDTIVSVRDCKSHLKIEDDHDDTYIDSLRMSAAARLSEMTGLSLVTQTFTATVQDESEPYDSIHLDRTHITDITAVKWLENGELVSADTTPTEPIGYVVRDLFGQKEISKPDGDLFEVGCPVSAEITYTRQLRAGTPDALIYRACVWDMVKSAYLHGAEFSDQRMPQSMAFAAAVRTLRDGRRSAKWTI